MRMRQWPQAFCALDEAIKLSRSNWKLWQNYLYTALSSDHVTAAVDAAENLLELQVQSRGFLLFVLSLHFSRCFMFCQGLLTSNFFIHLFLSRLPPSLLPLPPSPLTASGQGRRRR